MRKSKRRGLRLRRGVICAANENDADVAVLRGSHAQRRIWRTKNCAVVDIRVHLASLPLAARALLARSPPPSLAYCPQCPAQARAQTPSALACLAFCFSQSGWSRLVGAQRPMAEFNLHRLGRKMQRFLSPLSNRHQQMPHPYRVLFPRGS